MDPLKLIKKSTDKDFLNQMLTKWLPHDYANVEKAYPFEMEIKMIHKGKYTPDELLAKKKEGLDNIKTIVENRIKELDGQS